MRCERMIESSVSRQIERQMGMFDSGDVKSICKPLLGHFNIKYVTYSRIFRDSSEINLTTHPDWLEYYLTQQLFVENPLEKPIDHYRDGYALWSKALDDSYLGHMIEQQLQIVQAFVMVKPNLLAGYCDFYFFGSVQSGLLFEQNCLSNIDLFNQFIDHFSYYTNDIVDKMDRQRIIIPNKFESNVSKESHLVYIKEQVDRKQFMSDINQNGAIIKVGEQLIKLTKREAELMPLIVSGMSMREMANRCFISPRTIETHLGHIKQKLHVNSKSELIKKLRSS